MSYFRLYQETKRQIMKKLLFWACMSTSTMAAAQSELGGFHYGAKAGIGESTFSSAGLTDVKGRLLLMGGFSASYNFNNYFGLSAEFLATSKASNNRDKTYEPGSGGPIIGPGGGTDYYYLDRFRTIDIEIPILPRLTIGKNGFYFQAFAGPSINFNVLGVTSRTYEDANYHANNGYPEQPMNNLNTSSFSAVYGLGLLVLAPNYQLFSVDFRLNQGITPFGTFNGQDAKHNYFAISVGYAL